MKRRSLFEKALPSLSRLDEASTNRVLCQALVQHVPVAVAVLDSHLRFIGLSDRWRTQYGLGDGAVQGDHLYEVMPDAEALWGEAHARCLKGETVASEDSLLRADGREERVRWEARPLMRGARVTGLVMITEVVTRQRSLEHEARIRDAAMEAALSPLAMFDLDGTVTYANAAFAEVLGYARPTDLLGQRTEALWGQPGEAARIWQSLLDTGRWIGVTNAIRADGSARVAQVSVSLARGGDGAAVGAIASCVDITAQRETEKALGESQRRLVTLMDNLPGGFAFRCRNDSFWTMEIISKGCFDVLGYSPEALIDNRLVAFATLIHPEDDKRVRREILEAINLARPFQVSFRVITRKGDVKWLMQQGTPQFAGKSEVQALEGVVIDITDRVVATEDLHREKARAEQYLDVAASIILALDRQGRVTRFNRKGTEVTGYTEEELAGQNWFDLLVDPAERQEAKRAFAEIVAGDGEELPYLENQIRAKGGQRRVIGWNLARIRDQTGYVVSVLGSGEDLTEQREIERQLLQAQKMQAVGELTGGLAHDFNNLLMAVQGNIEFLRDVVPDDPSVERYTAAALKAVGRGAELTQRLLAFSRKQLLRPEPTSINRLVGDMTELLARTLGPHIRISTEVAADTWDALVDPAQLENALLNLAINARDAMKDGGTLTIATSNETLNDVAAARHPTLSPGQYVVIAVRDTGTGMTQEVLDRAFEPFFSTKDSTRGSGLGLSMVYGFVKQSGGHIEIQSEVGHGTSVLLHLPHASRAPSDALEDEDATAVIQGEGETILVVEDDEEVRSIIVAALKSLGYVVRQAPSAGEAQHLLDDGLRPHLLLTDVLQPHGKDGIQFAQEVHEAFPQCAILLMSGYTEDAMERNKQLDKPFALLRKPFGKAELSRQVRARLDARVENIHQAAV
ncbi:MAG: PAS domain S-box protein [Alphaproteobacteria bacterium]|nr:PAS domain S-box protein [Alphaproteobacteria bacterium]